MPKSLQDRTGQKRGKFTVIEDLGGLQLKCRCDCGREYMRPREMFKPSYAGLLACAYCLGSPCEVCGDIIPRKNKMPAKTCSLKCNEERHRNIERQRYYAIRFTPEFLDRQRLNREAYKQRMLNDAEFAERMRRAQRARVFMWHFRLYSDAERRQKRLAYQSAYNKAYRAAVLADPVRALELKIKNALYYRLVTKALI